MANNWMMDDDDEVISETGLYGSNDPTNSVKALKEIQAIFKDA